MKIYIRVDGNSTIGMGHIIRCTSLAFAAKNLGHEVIFLCRFKESAEFLRKKNYNCLIHKEIDNAKKLISIVKNNVLIIDKYDVDSRYFSLINTLFTVYIDDLNAFNYDTDIVVNGNFGAEEINYKTNAKLLLGVKYNLIRNEFNNISRRQIRRNIKTIMITTGGSNLYNQCERLVKILAQYFSDYTLNVIIGDMYKDTKEIEKLAKDNKNIILLKTPSKISEVMLNSDLAISSAGSTLYELCTCGIPSVSYILAENQEFLATNMATCHLISTLGWYNRYKDKQLINIVKKIAEDYEYRINISKEMQQLVDAKGAIRVIKEIEKLYEKRG